MRTQDATRMSTLKNTPKNKFSKAEVSWLFYDWANSAYILIVVTAVFPIFFKSVSAAGLKENIASAYFGYASTIYAMIVAALAPILGTIADYEGYKKKFLFFFFALGVSGTLVLAFSPASAWLITLLIFIISAIGFAGSNLFYDSFLPDVTSSDRFHLLSARGFAMGYIGSAIPFLIILLSFQSLPLFFENINKGQIARGSFVLAALWWFVFSIPIFKNVQQTQFVPKEKYIIIKAFVRLIKTFLNIRHYKYAFLFLVAYFFYIDGVSTIIKMAVPYALDIHINLSSGDLLLILLVIQLVAFPFALLYGFLANKFPRKIIWILMSAILVYLGMTVYAFFISTNFHFWILALLVALCQGGVQALSRSYFATLIPRDKSAEFFGFYNIFGKFAAIMGPFIVGTISQFKNIRFGVLGIAPLFIIGALLLSLQFFKNGSDPV